jgi:hypothetical protein
MSDRSLVTYYLAASQYDTTQELRAQLASMQGRRLPLAGRLVRDGLRSILAERSCCSQRKAA